MSVFHLLAKCRSGELSFLNGGKMTVFHFLANCHGGELSFLNGGEMSVFHLLAKCRGGEMSIFICCRNVAVVNCRSGEMSWWQIVAFYMVGNHILTNQGGSTTKILR